MSVLENARAEWESLDPDDREIPLALALKELIDSVDNKEILPMSGKSQSAKDTPVVSEEEITTFLYYYTTPEGRVSTQRVSLAADLAEWLELRAVEETQTPEQ